MASTNGTITRQTMSFTKNAENRPQANTTAGNRCSGFQPPQDKLHVPLEESHQVKIAHDQHHRKEQHDGGKINEMQGLAGGHDPECHHGDGADNRRPGAVNLEPRELPQSKYEVTGDENGIGGDQGRRRAGRSRGFRSYRVRITAPCGAIKSTHQ